MSTYCDWASASARPRERDGRRAAWPGDVCAVRRARRARRTLTRIASPIQIFQRDGTRAPLPPISAYCTECGGVNANLVSLVSESEVFTAPLGVTGSRRHTDNPLGRLGFLSPSSRVWPLQSSLTPTEFHPDTARPAQPTRVLDVHPRLESTSSPPSLIPSACPRSLDPHSTL